VGAQVSLDLSMHERTEPLETLALRYDTGLADGAQVAPLAERASGIPARRPDRDRLVQEVLIVNAGMHQPINAIDAPTLSDRLHGTRWMGKTLRPRRLTSSGNCVSNLL
jgi:hypothetical protein